MLRNEMKGRREVKKAGKRARGQYTQLAREEKEKKIENKFSYERARRRECNDLK